LRPIWCIRRCSDPTLPYRIASLAFCQQAPAGPVGFNSASASWPVLVCCGKTHFGPRRKAGLLSLAGRWFAASKCSAIRSITTNDNWMPYGLSRIITGPFARCRLYLGWSGLLSGAAYRGGRLPRFLLARPTILTTVSAVSSAFFGAPSGAYITFPPTAVSLITCSEPSRAFRPSLPLGAACSVASRSMLPSGFIVRRASNLITARRAARGRADLSASRRNH